MIPRFLGTAIMAATLFAAASTASAGSINVYAIPSGEIEDTVMAVSDKLAELGMADGHGFGRGHRHRPRRRERADRRDPGRVQVRRLQLSRAAPLRWPSRGLGPGTRAFVGPPAGGMRRPFFTFRVS
ncbi:hypothetical protein [Amorphus sp. MBR-141]